VGATACAGTADSSVTPACGTSMPAFGERYIKAGNLTALAVTTAARSEALPNIPTVADFVPGLESSAFYSRRSISLDTRKLHYLGVFLSFRGHEPA
jgi:tripartite-type tricarboxylate transporter receptor subunit TctC